MLILARNLFYKSYFLGRPNRTIDQLQGLRKTSFPNGTDQGGESVVA